LSNRLTFWKKAKNTAKETGAVVVACGVASLIFSPVVGLIIGGAYATGRFRHVFKK